MNIRRIPIALFILLGVCAALAYFVGSIRPFTPSAKFSNLPPTAANQVAEILPTNTSMLPPPSRTAFATNAAAQIVHQAAVNTSTPVRTLTERVTRVAARVTRTAERATRTAGHVTRTAERATRTAERVTRLANSVPRIAAGVTRIAGGVTRIAQATAAPTETPSLNAQTFAATQTTVPAQQTFSAIATRAFITPSVKKLDPNRAINKTTNFLLIGTDSRTDDPTWVPNTDVMMVLFLDTANQRAALLSLPRDLVVAIPGKQAFRINSAYHHGWLKEGVEGGVNVLMQVLRDDLSIRIDHWALIDFDGLSQIIDTLGGIEVNVPCALSDTIDFKPFTIPAGTVEMDYLTAKRYVQSRYTTSDTSRNHRQQRVVWAMAKKALGMNAPDRVPLMYEQLRENVATDMNLFSMVGLVPAVYQLDLQNHPERFRARVLEAPAVYPWISTSGAWLYMPNYDVIQQELDEIFASPQVALNEATTSECPRVPATPQPTDVPSETPSGQVTPTEGEIVTPAAEMTPTGVPTQEPTMTPVGEMTPTEAPTQAPTDATAELPTEAPTEIPTEAPTEIPTEAPTETPTEAPAVPETPVAVPSETPAS